MREHLNDWLHEFGGQHFFFEHVHCGIDDHAAVEASERRCNSKGINQHRESSWGTTTRDRKRNARLVQIVYRGNGSWRQVFSGRH